MALASAGAAATSAGSLRGSTFSFPNAVRDERAMPTARSVDLIFKTGGVERVISVGPSQKEGDAVFACGLWH